MSLVYPTKFEAIIALVGGGVSQNVQGEINYHEDTRAEDFEIPTDDAIAAKLKELKTDYDAKEYARNRKIEYDALNQFELMTNDNANSTTTHADAIAAIKTKWPKDNSGPK